jgi:hypothetical protein
VLGRRLELCLDRWSSGDRYICSFPSPDQNFPFLVPGKVLCLDQFDLHILKRVRIKVKTSFECPVGDASLASEEGDDLFQEGIEGHGGPSAVWTASRCEHLR